MNYFRDLFQRFFQPHFYAGRAAENLFLEMARREGRPVERIEQSRESYSAYASIEGRVKRGDILYRRLPGVEVEVKCQKRSGKQFKISYADWKGHENHRRINKIDDVIFVFFDRNKHQVIPDSMRCVSMAFVERNNDMKKLFYQFTDKNNLVSKWIKIPFENTRTGFRVFDILEQDIQTNY